MRSALGIQAGGPSLSTAAVCAIAATALAVAMGIGRFAFTPLLPLMLRDGALTPSAGAWLAASNYLGYLAGALTASRLGLSQPALMRASLVGIVIATAAMGAFDGVAAWIALRFVAGALSAYTLVATSAWALQHLDARGKFAPVRDYLRRRRPRHRAHRIVLCRGRATGRAGGPLVARTRGTGGARGRSVRSLSGPAVGERHSCAFDDAARRHARLLHGTGGLLWRARFRLYPARRPSCPFSPARWSTTRSCSVWRGRSLVPPQRYPPSRPHGTSVTSTGCASGPSVISSMAAGVVALAERVARRRATIAIALLVGSTFMVVTMIQECRALRARCAADPTRCCSA